MPRQITYAEQQAKRARAAAQAAAPTTASEATAAPVKRERLPDGQQRSRGRTILSAIGKTCSFGKGKCQNPARWPVGRVARLLKVDGVTATTVTCTTHLRTIARRVNVDVRTLEGQMVTAPKATRAPRTTRAPRPAPEPVVETPPAPEPEPAPEATTAA